MYKQAGLLYGSLYTSRNLLCQSTAKGTMTLLYKQYGVHSFSLTDNILFIQLSVCLSVCPSHFTVGQLGLLLCWQHIHFVENACFELAKKVQEWRKVYMSKTDLTGKTLKTTEICLN